METVKITKVISSGYELPIGKLDGKMTISQAKHLFRWIYSDFEKFGLDKPSEPTKKVNAVVYEMTADGTFIQIFKGIAPNLSDSALTMSQFINFCEQHPDWLRQEGFGTFFLVKKNANIFRKILARIMKLFGKKVSENYFVSRVHVYSDGLRVYVHRLENDYVWDGEDRHRLVSPQLGL